MSLICKYKHRNIILNSYMHTHYKQHLLLIVNEDLLHQVALI